MNFLYTDPADDLGENEVRLGDTVYEIRPVVSPSITGYVFLCEEERCDATADYELHFSDPDGGGGRIVCQTCVDRLMAAERSALR